jgi:hypothetical protein
MELGFAITTEHDHLNRPKHRQVSWTTQLLCLATRADAFPRFTFLAQTAPSGFHLELVKIGLRVVWAVTAKVPKVVTFLGSIRCHKKPPRISSCLSLSWESSLEHETWIAG